MTWGSASIARALLSTLVRHAVELSSLARENSLRGQALIALDREFHALGLRLLVAEDLSEFGRLLGSVARNVLLNAHCSVLVVRAAT